MRVRQVARLDLVTGTVAGRAEMVPGDADVQQRFAKLRASLPAGLDGERVATIACDGCTASAKVDYDNPRLPGGWIATPAGDFCPACHSSG